MDTQVATLFFSGNMETSRVFLQEHGYIPKMWAKRRFNRPQHQIAELFLVVFEVLGEFWKQLNEESVYIMDSFPISACDNYRIRCARLYQGEPWRGYQASKKPYVYGLKIHLLVTKHGQPVKFFLSPGSWSDTRALKMFIFDVPEGALLTRNKAYNDYVFEDLLKEAQLDLQPLDLLQKSVEFKVVYCRDQIETDRKSRSEIAKSLPEDTKEFQLAKNMLNHDLLASQRPIWLLLLFLKG